MSAPLENIGFYTLSDDRVRLVHAGSSLSRCELILTDKCNFKCPYCRGVKPEYSGYLSWRAAESTVKLWMSQGLKNIRFSGGEPLLYPGLDTLVYKCSQGGINRIAISTNGSLPVSRYQRLLDMGVNDFSVSLDACCASTGDTMAGGIKGAWEKVIKTLEFLVKNTYVTVGVVLTEQNIPEMDNTVKLAHSIGVADIRLISSAQYNVMLQGVKEIPKAVVEVYPILKYRVNNILNGRHVRGMRESDSHRCALVLDDMAVVSNNHFPCIIYLREGGAPIGKVGPEMRKERLKWFKSHNSFQDPICQKNCLDICCDYNNKYRELRGP